MSGGRQRRSLRVPMVYERKAARISENKTKGKGWATSEDSDSQEGSVNLNHKRKRTKTKSIQDLVGNNGYEDHSSDASEEPPVTLPKPVLPENCKLRLLLETLKKRDGKNIFAEPVNPDEVEGYYDTIKEPMDFSTMAAKLSEGRYQTLDEFERDATLVYSNAMIFNASSTVFYRQARFIRDLTKKLFALLKADPKNFERAVAKLKVRAGRREDTGVSTSKTRTRDHSTKGMALNGSKEEIQHQYDEEDQLGPYRPRDSLLKRNEAILSSLYKNAEPRLLMEATNLDEVGYKGSWKRFVKNLGSTAEMADGPKLSTDFKAFNNQSGTSPHQLQTPKYGTLNALPWSIEDLNTIPEDILRNAISSQYLSGLMGANEKKALAFDTLDYNENFNRGLLPITSGVGNPSLFDGKSLQASVVDGIRFKQSLTDQSVDSPHFSTPCNRLHNNSKNFLCSADKGTSVQMMQANSSNFEEIPGKYSRNSVQPPMVRNSFPKENTYHQFIGNYYSTPCNQDDFILGSIDKGKNILMEDPTAFYPLLSDGIPERAPPLSIKETEGAAVNRYLPNQGIGSSNYTTSLGAENSSISSPENKQGNSDKFYPGPGIMGMNIQMAVEMDPGVVQSNPYDNLKQLAQSMGINLGFRGGYFTNLLHTGFDPLAKFDAADDAEQFVQAAQYQDASSVQAPGINFSGRIQDPPSAVHHGIPSSASLQLPSPPATGSSSSQAANWLNLYSPGNDKDIRQLQAVGGYEDGTSSGGAVGQAGQNSSWPHRSEWTLQPNFYFPLQVEPRTAESGLTAQAAALLMQALVARGGADQQNMAGPSARNYPSDP